MDALGDNIFFPIVEILSDIMATLEGKNLQKETKSFFKEYHPMISQSAFYFNLYRAVIGPSG